MNLKIEMKYIYNLTVISVSPIKKGKVANDLFLNSFLLTLALNSSNLLAASKLTDPSLSS